MPNPPAHLDISCNGLSEGMITRLEEIVRNSGFYLDEQMAVTDEEYMFHISPFEKTEHNDSTVVQFKEKIESDFPELEVSLERNRNDPAHYGDFGYRMQIDDNNVVSDDPDQSKTSQTSADTIDTETPEWRSLDIDDGEVNGSK